MTDAIGMIEALSEWGEHLNRLEAAAKEDGIGPGDYLGNYHLAVMRVLRGLEAVEQARAAETREMFAEARSAAAANAEQARLELNKLEEATRRMQLEANKQKLTLEGAAASVIERVAEEIGKKVGDASVIRAKAYSRGQFAKTVAAGVAAVLLILSVGVGLGRASVALGPFASDTEEGN